MSVLEGLATLLPLSATVGIVLAAMKREDPKEILRVGAKNLALLAGGIVGLAAVLQGLIWLAA